MINVAAAEKKMAELATLLDTETIKKYLGDENLDTNLWSTLSIELEKRMSVKDYVAFMDSLFEA